MQFASDQERDQWFSKLMQIPENQKCFDCSSRFPQWASVSYGLFLCLSCSGKHRSYGPSISFVRSLTLDKWTFDQLEIMSVGGNKNFRAFLEQNGIQNPDYKNVRYEQYKGGINKKNISKKQEDFIAENKEENYREFQSGQDADFLQLEDTKQTKVNIIHQENIPVHQHKQNNKGGRIRLDENVNFDQLRTNDLDNRKTQEKTQQKKYGENQQDFITDNFYQEKPQGNYQPQKVIIPQGKNSFGSEDLFPEQKNQSQKSLSDFKIGNSFGSAQLYEKPEASATPFQVFLQQTKETLRSTTDSLMTQIRNKINKNNQQIYIRKISNLFSQNYPN